MSANPEELTLATEPEKRAIASTPIEASKPATLLCVDDEPNILSSLKRLFRPEGYKVLTAESGAEGLALLGKEPADLVISDMRMPAMDGAKFLESVRNQCPDAVRILLTGNADIESTIAAINKGQIYRYIAKPWEDNDMLLLVRHALERKHLEREKARLEKLTASQNEELKELNSSLEHKVAERTRELQDTVESLDAAHRRLKANFIGSVHIFSSLLNLRYDSSVGRSRRVGEHALALAQQMGLNQEEAQDVMIAGLLRDIATVAWPDQILHKPFLGLNNDERALAMKHPARAQGMLMGIDRLAGAALLIRSHHECYDGTGFPDRLAATLIPLGARILTVVSDYDALLQGRLVERKLDEQQAQSFLISNRGIRYDPDMVKEYLAFLRGGASAPSATPVPRTTPAPADNATTIRVRTSELRVGMVLAQDLRTHEGLLLLMKDRVLDNELIEKVRNFERSEGQVMEAEVQREAQPVLQAL